MLSSCTGSSALCWKDRAREAVTIGRVGAVAALALATLSGGITAQEATGRVEGWVLAPDAQPALRRLRPAARACRVAATWRPTSGVTSG